MMDNAISLSHDCSELIDEAKAEQKANDERASQCLSTWIRTYSENQPSEVTHASEAEIRFDQWCTSIITSLLDLALTSVGKLILTDSSLSILSKIADSPPDRIAFTTICLTTVWRPFKERFGMVTWAKNMVQEIINTEASLDLATATGVYVYSVSLDENDPDQPHGGETYTCYRRDHKAVTCWGMYSGQTLIGFEHRWGEHRKVIERLRRDPHADSRFFHAQAHLATDGNITKCPFADLTRFQNDDFAHPVLATFMETVCCIFIGSFQINGYDSLRETIDFVHTTRPRDMPVLEWAGWNRALPISQGIRFDTWARKETNVLRSVNSDNMLHFNVACQQALAEAGFVRSVQAIQWKRYKLGLTKSKEETNQNLLDINALEVDVVEAIVEKFPESPQHIQAMYLFQSLKAVHNIARSEQYCDRLIKSLFPVPLRLGKIIWTQEERELAAAIRENYGSNPVRVAMATELRDKLLDSSTNRSLRNCVNYFARTWPDGSRRKQNGWTAAEVELLGELRDQHKDYGKQKLATLCVTEFKRRLGIDRSKSSFRNEIYRRYHLHTDPGSEQIDQTDMGEISSAPKRKPLSELTGNDLNLPVGLMEQDVITHATLGGKRKRL